jgi:hypothetical protein
MVNYVNQYGDVLFTEPLTEQGEFKFHAVEKEIFELKLKRSAKCDELELALIDDSENIIRKITMKDGCLVTKDKLCIIGTEMPFLEEPSYKYQISVKGAPLTSGHFVDYLDLVGSKIWSETIDQGGTFTFHEIPSEDAYIFEVWMDDPNLCDQIEVKLLDADNNVVRTSTIDKRCKQYIVTDIQGNYEEFFGYNLDGKEQVDDKLNRFVSVCVDILNQNGRCSIDILGSASTVPTKTHKSNQHLAKKRADKGKRKISKALKKAKVDLSKIDFSVISKVQGPSYARDASDTKKYGPYQYVKITAK